MNWFFVLSHHECWDYDMHLSCIIRIFFKKKKMLIWLSNRRIIWTLLKKKSYSEICNRTADNTEFKEHLIYTIKGTYFSGIYSCEQVKWATTSMSHDLF